MTIPSMVCIFRRKSFSSRFPGPVGQRTELSLLLSGLLASCHLVGRVTEKVDIDVVCVEVVYAGHAVGILVNRGTALAAPDQG